MVVKAGGQGRDRSHGRPRKENEIQNGPRQDLPCSRYCTSKQETFPGVQAQKTHQPRRGSSGSPQASPSAQEDHEGVSPEACGGEGRRAPQA